MFSLYIQIPIRPGSTSQNRPAAIHDRDSGIQLSNLFVRLFKACISTPLSARKRTISIFSGSETAISRRTRTPRCAAFAIAVTMFKSVMLVASMATSLFADAVSRQIIWAIFRGECNRGTTWLRGCVCSTERLDGAEQIHISVACQIGIVKQIFCSCRQGGFYLIRRGIRFGFDQQRDRTGTDRRCHRCSGEGKILVIDPALGIQLVKGRSRCSQRNDIDPGRHDIRFGYTVNGWSAA